MPVSYTGTGDEGRFGKNHNPAKIDFQDASKKDLPLELTRQNHVLEDRGNQMEINLLGLEGGRAYVNRRLSRHAGESKIDWEGGTRADGTVVTGRKQQSHSFPYLRRIADKIDQYIFSEEPKREGISEDVLDDASADGTSLNAIMQEANDYVTACGWCWLGVDAPSVEGQVSVASKAANKIRPYINVYSPLAVKDWKFNAIGQLEWLITECESMETIGISEPAEMVTTRNIWSITETGAITVSSYRMGMKENKVQVLSEEVTTVSAKVIPFVLVGSISCGGHTFDDIESVNRTIMDLESVNRANIFKRCYPQLILPVECIQNMSDSAGISAIESQELIIGMNYPILIDKDSASASYLMPSATDMGAIRTELQQLKHNMFDSVGLMLQVESKQVASAESKAWDFLDVAQVMAHRAGILQDAENKISAIVNGWDSTIPQWTAVYNRDFDIGDFLPEISALVMAGNVSMPPAMEKMVLTKLAGRLDRVGSALTPEQREEVQAAIDSFDSSTFAIDDTLDIDV